MLPDVDSGERNWPNDRARKIWETVKEAQEAALTSLEKKEVRAMDVDRAARDVIEREGWGIYFNHRLGHGGGLQSKSLQIELSRCHTNDLNFHSSRTSVFKFWKSSNPQDWRMLFERTWDIHRSRCRYRRKWNRCTIRGYVEKNRSRLRIIEWESFSIKSLGAVVLFELYTLYIMHYNSYFSKVIYRSND